ncbi:uncharacterized protein Bfra_002715 [Botrytis fragariae]|uniref:Uncharacterized protein n=1 Tax=Botrytis fragariae TaxID=1964551 RepID=A0A8H6AYT7_9HELO|nr:uncharacterized protein Bfra_002715 [Botrytis fragariae]KAF5876311.1 hypothetical protein Bfra_002715 [Botrytis fragariae]
MKPEPKFNEPLDQYLPLQSATNKVILQCVDKQAARPVVCFSPRPPLILHHTNIGGAAEKETWFGCGQHLPSVFSSIPADQECTCIPKFEKDGVQYPPKVGTGTAQDAGEEGDVVIHDLKRDT